MSGTSATAELPNDVESLKRLVTEMQSKLTAQEALIVAKESVIASNESIIASNESVIAANKTIIQVMQDEIALLKKLKFSASSEKWSDEDKHQMRLFDEAERIFDDHQEQELESEEITYKRRKKGRKPLPSDIPRRVVVHELDESERCCPHCDASRPIIGYEISEELRYVPARTEVVQHKREKAGPCTCAAFTSDESAAAILTASAPARILPGSIASSGLLAYIITSKFCDALPFYRQSRLLERNGIFISRANMANWTIKAASKCEGLIDLMRKRSREGPLINMDETTLQVLKEPGRKAITKSYMWVTVASLPPGKLVLYNYSRTRSSEVPLSLLDGFSGVLQSDGYAGYDTAVDKYGLRHIGCLAHLRRKFYDAAKITKSGGPANKPLKHIGGIYKVEKKLRSRLEKGEISSEEFAHLRRVSSAPHWKAFWKWLKETRPLVPPKTTLGRAVNYAWNEFPKIVKYLVQPMVTPDNNVAERAIRPFVVGRKNWLFSDSPRGAHASAVMYSLIETAKANGRNPQEYLYQLFEALPSIPNGDSAALEGLLPWNVGDVGK